MTNNSKTRKGIIKWAKAMFKTKELKKMKKKDDMGWFDEEEVLASILAYVKKEGVDLWTNE